MTTTTEFLRLINRLNLSLTALQRATGLSRRQLSRYRTGEAEPTPLIMAYLRELSDKRSNLAD